MAKVNIFKINTTDGYRYGIEHAANGQVFQCGTKWKTAGGARKYAEKNGHVVLGIEK